jgi:NAD(P)-dependent dehydrogenase (short-subunit alcohol dehydrogenase family)
MSSQPGVAIVTGGAGKIGHESARAMLEAGWRVALLDRRKDHVWSVAEDLARLAGKDAVIALCVDQTDREQVDAGVEQIEHEFGPITGLFANAGFGQFASFLETSGKAWQKHLDINLTGTFNVCQAVARVMVAAHRPGAIVLNASSGAWVHCDLLSAYCSTKAGLRMLAIGMASELGGHRIRVNCIMPGVIETGMTEPMLNDPSHREWILSETPVGRLGLPTDVAALVAFLLSDRAEFITGACVPIDGGQTIHAQPRWFGVDYRLAHDEAWRVPRS